MVRDIGFGEAENIFQEFLVSQALSPDLIWVFREDLGVRAEGFLIKSPVPQENRQLAEAYYEVGRKRDLGIGLHAFCLLDSHPCCFVELPEDEIDAESMLMGNRNLKCSVSNRLIKAHPITDEQTWRRYKLLDRDPNNHLFIPNKLPSKTLVQN